MELRKIQVTGGSTHVVSLPKKWVDRNRLGRSGAMGSIDRAKMNPKGSSVALGHPFAATGARIVMTAAKQLAERGAGRALISICAAGGMGVTAIVER